MTTLIVPASVSTSVQYTVLGARLTRRNFGTHYNNTPLHPNGTFNDAVLPGTSSFGRVRIFSPAFGEMWTGRALVESAVVKWLRIVNYWGGKDIHVLWCAGLLPGQSNVMHGNDITQTGGRLAHQASVQAFLQALFSRPDVQAVAARLSITSVNEPLQAGREGNATWGGRWAETGSNGATQCAAIQRVLWLTVKALAPQVLIGTPDLQGGETNELRTFLLADAGGVAIKGDFGGEMVGAGVRNKAGAYHFDFIAWHPYGARDQMRDVMGPVGLVVQDIAQGMRAVTTALDHCAKQRDSPLYGGDMAALRKWATEYNITGASDPAPGQFRYQGLTDAQITSKMEMLLSTALNLGFEAVFLYISDGFFNYGPESFGLSAVNAGAPDADGRPCLRLTCQNGAGSGYFQNGDDVTILAAPPAARASVGRTFPCRVVSPGTVVTFDLPGSVYAGSVPVTGWHFASRRAALGGWTAQAGRVIDAMTSDTYTGGFMFDNVKDPMRPFYAVGNRLRVSVDNAFRDGPR